MTVREVNENLAGLVDFCVLPGDNADDGTPEQYALIRAAVDQLTLPLHVIPGDHDFKQGSLRAFYEGLKATRLPYSVVLRGCRCFFLDAVSRGGGGPDFHLGHAVLRWLEEQLDEASALGQPTIIFVHAYPADFPRDRHEFTRLLQQHRVRVVDMGHTHYNELANDGTTVFATTRSTGQIEEGAVGFSIVTLQHGVVNWRFKPLLRSWPFVMITTPGDYRLQPDCPLAATAEAQSLRVMARAWGSSGIESCRFRIDGGEWQQMTAPADDGVWASWCDRPADRFVLKVTVSDASGRSGSDCITVAGFGERPPARAADGSDADALGVWPERHLLGTRLGPNRNGRQW